MPLPFPNLIFTDGNHGLAEAVTLPEFSAPLAGVNVDYLLTQDFQIDINSFAPLALNTPHPDFTAFLLASESNKRAAGGGDVVWTRTYAKKPASYSEPGGNYNYSFVGFFGSFGIGVTTVTGRERKVLAVPVQIQRDFYLVDAGGGGDYLTWQAIPILPEQKYYYGGTILLTDYIADSPPLAVATTPSRTAYEALVTADAADVNSFSIIVESSTVTRWQGNLFMRETRRVKAL